MARGSGYLVAVDFSPESRRALEAARALAAKTGEPITLVHIRPFSDVRAAVAEERGDLIRLAAGPLARAIAGFYASRFATWARDGERTLLIRGSADHALQKEAGRGYEMLFVGRRGRGDAPVSLIGSTVDRILPTIRIPVVVVPSR